MFHVICKVPVADVADARCARFIFSLTCSSVRFSERCDATLGIPSVLALAVPVSTVRFLSCWSGLGPGLSRCLETPQNSPLTDVVDLVDAFESHEHPLSPVPDAGLPCSF